MGGTKIVKSERDRIAELEARVSQLERSDNFTSATVGPGDLIVKEGGSIRVLDGGDIAVEDGGVVTIDGSLIVTGVQTVNGNLIISSPGLARSSNFVAGSAGWRLQSNGDAEFNDLTLRGGIIGNDALAEPVEPRVANNRVTGFPLFTTGPADYAPVAITAPAGFTQVLVMAVVNVSLATTISGGMGTAYNVSAVVEGTASDPVSSQVVMNGGLDSASNSFAFSGAFTGGVVNCAVRVSVQNPPALDFGLAHIAVTALFLR